MSDDEDKLTRLKMDKVLRERLPRELLRAKSFEHVLSLLLVRVEVEPEQRPALFYPLLKAVAKNVRQSIRAIDLAVRWNDDVVLMLAETPKAGALRLGEKLAEVMDQAEFHPTAGSMDDDDTPPPVEARPHIRYAAVSFPEDGETQPALLEALRQALEPVQADSPSDAS